MVESQIQIKPNCSWGWLGVLGHTLIIPLQIILIQGKKIFKRFAWLHEEKRHINVIILIALFFLVLSLLAGGGIYWFCVNCLYRWSLSFSPRIINSKSQVAHKISVIKKQIFYLQVCLSRYRQEILAWNIISIFSKLPREQKK